MLIADKMFAAVKSINWYGQEKEHLHMIMNSIYIFQNYNIHINILEVPNAAWRKKKQHT